MMASVLTGHLAMRYDFPSEPAMPLPVRKPGDANSGGCFLKVLSVLHQGIVSSPMTQSGDDRARHHLHPALPSCGNRLNAVETIPACAEQVLSRPLALPYPQHIARE